MMEKAIRQRIEELCRKKYELTEKYEDEIKEIEREIKTVRTICAHGKTTYHPDPSGNNDSFESCDICGAEARRLRRRL